MSSAYISPIASNVYIIGDDNAHTVLNPPPGYGKGHENRDYAADPVGANFATPPDDFLIDMSLWAEMIEEGDRNESSLMHMWLKAPGSKPPNQNGTNYCWAFGAIDAVKAFLIRTGAGYIDLSPASVACKVKNFANQGGYDMQAVKYAAQHGVCECKYWPEHSRDRKYDNAESQENRKKYIIDKWWDVPDDLRFEYKVSSAAPLPDAERLRLVVARDLGYVARQDRQHRQLAQGPELHRPELVGPLRSQERRLFLPERLQRYTW